MTGKKFLKRFERLENNVKPQPEKGGLKASKRFDHLEVGNKKIEVTITDKVTELEKAPVETEVVYYFLCPFCGVENAPNTKTCTNCRQPLNTEFAQEYQIKAKWLKKCPACQAINQTDRRNCWICGKEFALEPKQEGARSENVITLQIDGKEYKSTDKLLPADIRMLMERIRREGYKKELIDDWMQKRSSVNELEKTLLETRVGEARREYLTVRNTLILGGVLTGLYILARIWISISRIGSP